MTSPENNPTQNHPTRPAGLEPVPTEDGYIIYEQANDRIHYLNPVAALIFELCSGSNSPSEIAQLVRETFGLTDLPVSEVDEALNKMKSEGLLV